MAGGAGCFEGPHMWWLGWYKDRHVEIDPSTPTDVKIYTIADYESSPDDGAMVVKAGDYYLMVSGETRTNIYSTTTFSSDSNIFF